MDERNDFDEHAYEDAETAYTDDVIADEDFSSLEDGEIPETATQNAGAGSGSSINPDTPLYRLRLGYSHETFLAAFSAHELKAQDTVVVGTRYGRDLAEVIGRVSNAGYTGLGDVALIERSADEADLERAKVDAKKEADAFKICREKIDTHRLDMKLVSVHYLLEEPKILFFFTAENRVDFRELVKDLVGIFKTRIELRQIGVRDESRVVGGLGVCGRGYCCHSVSDKLKPVSIKMAKDQNLSLNSMKISGPCGRLLCCLAYEHGFYHEERRIMPPEGCRINHAGVNWKVTEVNPVAGRLKIVGEDGRQIYLTSDRFERSDGRWRMREDALRDVEQAPSSHTH
jgi:cell fate regulator YaaT (PSP1 superfamily)